MTYHTNNSSSYSRKGSKFVKIKDNVEAPKGFHFMPNGKLMNDADHIAANGYIQKQITGFDIDTHDIAIAGESRAFTINGEAGAFFSLEVWHGNPGDLTSAAYYDFSNKTFSSPVPQALKVELDKPYLSSIFFPGETQGTYHLNLTADTVDNIKTVYRKTVEFRNYDGSLNINKTTGSESNIIQKIIQSPEKSDFRISCVAPSLYTPGVTQTVFNAVSSANRVFFDNGLSAHVLPSGNIRSGDLITGTGVVIADWQLLSVVNPDNDNTREIQLSYAQSISNDVVLTFTPAFNGVTPHFTDSNTGSDAFEVSPGSSFTTSFSVTIVAPSGRLLSILKTPTERDVCCVESIVLGDSGPPLDGSLPRKFEVVAGDGVARLSSGMMLDPRRSVNTLEGSFLSPYVESETTQEIVNDGYNVGVRTSTIKKVINEAVEVTGIPTAAWSDGKNKSQKGNIIFNKGQIGALAEDTVNIFAHGIEQISKMNAGMTFSLSNVVLTGNDVTLTTGAASTGTAITVTECANAAVGVELSGVNINPLVANPTVTLKSKRSGAGVLTVSSAQPIEDGQKLKVVGGHTQIVITGNIDIKNFPVDPDGVTLLFDLERFLGST